MVVPVLKALATAYPDWNITMLSRKAYANLFQELPENVHFFGADLQGQHRGITGLNRLLHDLHYRELDAVADLHDVLRTQFLRHRCLWSGKRVAHIHKDRHQKWLLTQRFYRHKHPLPSTISRYQSVLEELGFELPPFTNNLPSALRQNIGIAPFAAHRGKIYPLDKMEQVVKTLGEKLAAQGEKVYLFGAGDKEKTILTDWQNKYKGVESLVGRYTMNEEIQLMAHLRLMLTMDSSNMHLASLAGTRVLSIWGATHPWAGFLGYCQSENDCIQLDLPCRPCSIYGKRTCKFRDYRCLNINPNHIVERVLNSITQEE